MRFSTFTTVILIIAPIILTLVIWGSQILDLNDAEKFSNTIQLWACAGALISAIYIISSYITTNKAFIHSQKPILTISAGQHPQKIVRDRESNEEVHATQIVYANVSNNPFYDLTLSIKIICGHIETDISDIFKPKMYLGPHDSRNRNFITKDILQEKGFNLDRQSSEGKQIIMQLGFSYTFLSKPEAIKAQSYTWSPTRQAWDIET